MKHRRSFGVAALVAGAVVLDGGQALRAAEIPSVAGQQMYAPAMSETRHSPGYIGVEMRDLSEDQLGSLKLKDAHGVEITNLDHDGPACKAGMKIHDVILQMNGQTVEGGDQLRRMLREVPVGRTVTFVVSRDGQSQALTLTDGRSQDGGAASVGAALHGACTCRGTWQQLYRLLEARERGTRPRSTRICWGQRPSFSARRLPGQSLK